MGLCVMRSMSKTNELISIAMPVLNCEGTITLSVTSILKQRYRDWELLAIDDGSQDRTVEILRGFADPRINVIADHCHRGLPARLNQAVSMARGKYFARMDGDDVMFPDRLERQIAFLQAHPEIDLVGGAMVVFGNDGKALGIRPAPSSHAEICKRPWSGIKMAHPTWMGRIEWFRRNPYRENAIRMEDMDLLLRTFRESHFSNLPDVVLGYRESELPLRKLFPSRRNLCKLLAASAGHELSYFEALRGLVGQVIRTTADVVAIATGLNQKLLRHRARPLPAEICARWNEVKQEINFAVSGVSA